MHDLIFLPWIQVKPNGTGLSWFEQRWNKIANMIFLESPAGVGYSYDENDNYTVSDDSVSFVFPSKLFKRVVARRAVYHTLNVITISLYVCPSVCVKRV